MKMLGSVVVELEPVLIGEVDERVVGAVGWVGVFAQPHYRSGTLHGLSQ